jgi:4-amino-4-deoxy-L-arabinose transferase-like glycosyltransferase
MTLLLWYGLLKPYVSQEKLAIWFMVMLVMPLTGPGSLIMVPDLPLMFFWSLAIFAMTRALKTGKLQWYFCLGMAIGLGFCSKYHIVLFPFILVIWLTFGKHWQKINLSHFFITVSSALLFSLPVIIWNFNNDFVFPGFIGDPWFFFFSPHSKGKLRPIGQLWPTPAS